MAEKMRVFKTAVQDVLNSEDAVRAAIESGLPPEAFESFSTVAESTIASFCKGCDNSGGESKPCKLVGPDDQARYAIRNWCGYAAVSGERGEMTAKGFNRWDAKKS